MNVYEISYQAALDGKYAEPFIHYDPFGRYFDERGARVERRYGDPTLELSSDHLQNFVNLIYSGRKHGIDEIVIRLDHEESKSELFEHSYAVGFLPEVLDNFKLENEQPLLRVTFREGVHTPGYTDYPRGTSPIDKELAGMSKNDLDDLFDEIVANMEANKTDNQKTVLPKNAFEALPIAVSGGTYRAVSLPSWVIEKYQLSGDDAIPGKQSADNLAKLAEIFRDIPSCGG